MSDKEFDPLVETKAAAAHLGISVPTLERLRGHGGGPRFYRLGERLIRYRISDLESWIRPANSTSEFHRPENKRAR